MSFPRYSEYRDSGVAWLGIIPKHWRIAPVKHLVRFFSGGTPSKENDEYWGGDIPWASAKDMKADFLSNTEDHLTSDAIDQGAATLLNSGTVLIVVRGMILVRTFPVTVTRVPMAINQDLKGLVAGAEILPEFLALYLRGTADESLRRLDEAGHGTKALRMDAWASLPIALPTIAEQSAILAFLSRETVKIDALVAEQERLIALLKEKRQAVISHAVTKGLNPEAPMKDSGVAWLGKVPKHWEVKRLKHVSPEITVGIVVEPSKYYCEEGVPALRSLNVQPGRIVQDNLVYISSEANATLAKSKLKTGDLVAVRSGQPGTTAVVPPELDGCNCIDLIIIRKPIVGCEQFLCWYLASDMACRQFTEGSGGAIQQHFNIGTAMDLLVTLPPHQEQAMIAAHLDSETSKLDALIIEAQRAIDLLKEHRSALISAAVTGKIDVRGLVEAEAAA